MFSMLFKGKPKSKEASLRNRALLFPFISIIIILAIMHYSPIHDALMIRSGEMVLMMFTMKDGEGFEIIYFDEANGVKVVNNMDRQETLILMRSMAITGNEDYSPSRESLPDAEYIKTDDGYLITGIDRVYNQLELINLAESSYTIGFRGEQYILSDYLPQTAVLALEFRKVTLDRIIRLDPNFGRK